MLIPMHRTVDHEHAIPGVEFRDLSFPKSSTKISAEIVAQHTLQYFIGFLRIACLFLREKVIQKNIYYFPVSGLPSMSEEVVDKGHVLCLESIF